jgi:hypothetical protein
MRIALFLILSAIILAEVQAHECDSVLIPTIYSFEHDVRTTLSTLSVIESNSSQNRSTKDQFGVTVPIYGVPVQFGYESGDSSQFRNRTLNYFNQHLTDMQATSYLNADVSADKTTAWAECMQRYTPFLVYFNRQTIMPDTATLWVRRYVTGRPRNSELRITIHGGTIDGKSDIRLTTDITGEQPYVLKRDQNNELVTVEATMDNSPPSTAIIPKVVPPPKVPDVAIRVTGKLQQAIVNETYPTGQFNLTVSKHVRFDPNQVSLQIDQLVSGNVCRSKTITSSALGDMMDSSRRWRLDDMKVGCQVPNTQNATVVLCFVDPLYFTECARN